MASLSTMMNTETVEPICMVTKANLAVTTTTCNDSQLVVVVLVGSLLEKIMLPLRGIIREGKNLVTFVS